jgi:hypothetical protein
LFGDEVVILYAEAAEGFWFTISILNPFPLKIQNEENLIKIMIK